MRVYIENSDDVRIQLYFSGSNDPVTFVLEHATPDDGLRNLIRKQIEEDFSHHIQSFRRAAYERGRRSVRDKDAKVTDFNSCFNDSDVGY